MKNGKNLDKEFRKVRGYYHQAGSDSRCTTSKATWLKGRH